MKPMTPAMLLKALKLFRGFTKAAGEYLRDKERLRYLLAAAVSMTSPGRTRNPSCAGLALTRTSPSTRYKPGAAGCSPLASASTIALLREKHGIACDLLHGFNWDKWTSGTPNPILGRPNTAGGRCWE